MNSAFLSSSPRGEGFRERVVSREEFRENLITDKQLIV